MGAVEIMGLIGVASNIIGHLVDAHNNTTAGVPLTPEQQAAIDATLLMKENRLLAAIDSKIGPDPKP